jgi:hypothetical protein
VLLGLRLKAKHQLEHKSVILVIKQVPQQGVGIENTNSNRRVANHLHGLIFELKEHMNSRQDRPVMHKKIKKVLLIKTNFSQKSSAFNQFKLYMFNRNKKEQTKARKKNSLLKLKFAFDFSVHKKNLKKRLIKWEQHCVK